ncbi:Hypothetical protein Minf_1707 [Methylacidiphilum infernorum V4]|uniref:Uncharacterized protein n=1 Tax=Methylacidiphilum infernorum (isolate V4) TaxID=481448 RepID=B3DWU8_METI4|nr:Hypothetical protein Minf_1707 [Methylacidiphilum infernorum V4]
MKSKSFFFSFNSILIYSIQLSSLGQGNLFWIY